jgi:predicted PhzF superfamily epimerase YddE/YHI9
VVEWFNVYALTRHYGGPEEGGWWFNAGVPVASIPLMPGDTVDTYQPHLQALKERHEEGDIYSVCGGVQVEGWVQDHPARVWPEERPHYE